jgi:tRNA(Ile)-lysidine synthase
MPEKFPQALETHLAGAWPTDRWRSVGVLVAISGGADSVAMSRALARLAEQIGGAGELHLAHFNHRLRAEESDADAAWVAEFAAQLRLPFHIAGAESARCELSEADARAERYAFLVHAAERLGARYVAVAHTADDQVETALFRMLRGTGLAGLAGMPPARALSPSVTLVRPLLTTSRSDVLAYLAGLGQPYRTDSTNAATHYRRNWLRHELLPRLRDEFGSQVDAAIARLVEQARESQELISEVAERLLANTVGECRLQRETLASAPAIVGREAIKLAWRQRGWPEQDLTAALLGQVLQLAIEGGAPVNLPYGVRASVKGTWLVLESLSTPQ